MVMSFKRDFFQLKVDLADRQVDVTVAFAATILLTPPLGSIESAVATLFTIIDCSITSGLLMLL